MRARCTTDATNGWTAGFSQLVSGELHKLARLSHLTVCLDRASSTHSSSSSSTSSSGSSSARGAYEAPLLDRASIEVRMQANVAQLMPDVAWEQKTDPEQVCSTT
jgi:hypothetical protein